MASIDRLSDLPDEILSHILSFLPIKTSVSTSTLAARWRFVWAYSPNIQIVERSMSFFAYRDVLRSILPQCEAHSVITLRIIGDIFFDCELEMFLESAFACKTKTLEITQTHDYCDLPPCVLTSQTLVDLKLSRFFVKMKDVTVCLPALERLHIKTTRLDDGSLENLISGCPVLEEFTYIDCYECVDSHCISSSTMKKLVLEPHFRNKLKIDTPALEYLLIHYSIPQKLSFGPMDSLIGAHIVVRDDTLTMNGDLYSLVEFLGRFSNVKEMSLCPWSWGVKAKVHDLTSVDLNIKFHNLAKLTVEGDWRIISYFVEKANKLEVLNVTQYSEWEMEETPQLPLANSIMKLHNLIKLELQVDWWFLTLFLDKADKLKVLIIRNNDYRKQKRKRWLAAPLQVPNCLSSHLKILQIHELHGTDEHELDMVRYLLKNALVLERMDLYCHEGMERHCIAESIGRISSFDRGSEKCEIVLTEYLGSDND
ncbi:Unknown protein [Striga hermonthica]|uniref:F-box domain-containing protein n=1 Tax=Striga hermonthica TaxID=68872 RepID=A0A9N7MYX7_STRHE|nr:Unknown protein [Striga hermonthica]